MKYKFAKYQYESSVYKNMDYFDILKNIIIIFSSFIFVLFR